ncbi:tRNA lysidine(34) synthetase TilS [Aeromicrobium sp. PE09-221]|uniref:tRNA lysidine(34) synthetase TilS n=1 Tax=Aeromicrobium sp. PE09-221 TaxID=1898043 RepID=UPI000B3E67CA|nr:tRNA lysidine(34) synthetase TilS [Aeromicrobium sp. PE09-221]OUZ07494.1 tRNA lysidine(34) synthetase TilS [Aeromicrobium sp. PE09-221]
MPGRLDPVVARARSLVRAALEDDPRAVVIALSGGADSLALTAVTAFVAQRMARPLRAVVVDHGLQEVSADAARRAADTARSLGVAAEVVEIHVDPADSRGLEAAARDARYAALDRVAVADDAQILLAHTLDDQAETVLLGLGRGSGARSLAGMAGRRGRLVRPLLTLRRADTERICRVHGLDWWSDPYNADPRLRRTRVRHELLPLMEEVLGGGAAQALARTADLLRADADALDTAAETAMTDEIDALAVLAPAIRSRVLRRAAIAAGARPGELTAAHVDGLESLVTRWHGQRRVELPGGVSAVRAGNRLRFIPTPVAG